MRILSILFLGCLFVCARLVWAQPNLRLVNADTQVSKIAFRGHSFPEEQLLEVISTQAPTAFDRLAPSWASRLAFREVRQFPFNPYEVQKDVIRLRRFYQRNGYLSPRILSQFDFDPVANKIKVFFNISEGPPLTIQEILFFGPDGRDAFYQFPDASRNAWRTFRDPFIQQFGERFSELAMAQFREKAVRWMKDKGFAYAQLRDVTMVDTLANLADVTLYISPGPRCSFGKIRITGLEHISVATVLNLLTFREGDPFSYRQLEESKRQIFESSQFRFALFSIPTQPLSDKVDVIFEVREAKLRSVSGQLGLSSDTGPRLEGKWEHRNFLGSARTLSAQVVVQPGDSLGIFRSYPIEKKYRGSLSFRQPHFFYRKLSVLTQPYVEYTNDFLNTPQTSWGVDTSFLLRLSQYQNLNIAFNFSRVTADPATLHNSDQYNQAAIAFSGTLGKVDNILFRTRGWLIKPSITLSGRPGLLPNAPKVLISDLNYLKTSLEGTAYTLPLQQQDGLPDFLRRASLNVRLFAGKMWTADRVFEDDKFYTRYYRLLYFGGGDRDVRGWRNKYLGPRDEFGFALGGTGKITGNIETQIPLPSLNSLRGVAFLDFGNVWTNQLYLNPAKWKFGTGAGIRFLVAGFTGGADLGIKLNPDYQDLHNADGVRCRWYDILGSCSPLSLHIQFGQTF
ncbi:MAG: BamA/TamA family outer membrane protein [Bacteroidetes Order II. Incertae sedis bacterium]|nr:BamA/TamA family outer membrane protein [Bacteroidetes Order II. bacterium]